LLVGGQKNQLLPALQRNKGEKSGGKRPERKPKKHTRWVPETGQNHPFVTSKGGQARPGEGAKVNKNGGGVCWG